MPNVFSLPENKSTVTIGCELSKKASRIAAHCPMGHCSLWSCRLCCYGNHTELQSCIHTWQNRTLISWAGPQRLSGLTHWLEKATSITDRECKKWFLNTYTCYYMLWERIKQWLRGQAVKLGIIRTRFNSVTGQETLLSFIFSTSQSIYWHPLILSWSKVDK